MKPQKSPQNNKADLFLHGWTPTYIIHHLLPSSLLKINSFSGSCPRPFAHAVPPAWTMFSPLTMLIHFSGFNLNGPCSEKPSLIARLGQMPHLHPQKTGNTPSLPSLYSVITTCFPVYHSHRIVSPLRTGHQ